MRKLASIQVIDKIDPIMGKDLIGLAKILGWHVIVRKSEFSIGDKCIYFEVDSLLPETPDFEFLRKKEFRIKTMRMGGVISEGLAMPITILPVGEYNVGDDVTDIIGVKKYENDADLQGEQSEEVEEKKQRSKFVRFMMKFSAFRKIYLYFNPGRKSYGEFPESIISKTDETRIQAVPWVFDENKGKKYVLGEKIDGCLDGKSLITTDIGQISIRRIVNQKLPVSVLTYNEETKQCEFKKIIDYHKINSNRKKYKVSIGFRGKGNREKSIFCTDNHKFYTDSGWKEAKDLVIGENVYHFNRNMPNELIEVTLGCLLGDSSVNSNSDTGEYRTISFNHSEKQGGYFEYKKKLFGECFIGQMTKISGYGSRILTGCLKANLSINKILNKHCVRDNHRFITEEWMNMLTPLSLAFWYMDDGTLKNREDNNLRCRVQISTNRYSTEENIMFQKMFKNKFNIDCTIGAKETYKGHTLIFDADNTEKLCSLIAPYICECMKYKLPKPYENLKCYLEDHTFNLNDGIIITKVLNTRECSEKEMTGCYVFDLTVEDNCNYFANNILVHNCSFSTVVIYNKQPWFRRDKYDFLACSRNRLAGNGSVYWEMVEKYLLKEKLTSHLKHLRDLDRNITSIAIQGEIVGPKIQGNKYKLTENKLFIFNVVCDGERIGLQGMIDFCNLYGLDTVPIIDVAELPETLDQLVEMSNGQSVIGPTLREGLVCRLLEDYSKSFKVISPEFKIKYGL